MRIGSDFRLGSRPAPSHLVTGPRGLLTIGDRVSISYGAALSANRDVRIGDDCRIGPFVVIADSDFHSADDRNALPETTPVSIGKGVVIGSRVTILRGTTVEDGARLLAGSVVSGTVPAGAVFAGVPARQVNAAGTASSETDIDVPELVMRVFALAERPGPNDGPNTLRGWDSLGALKLLLALEEAYGVALREEEMATSRSVAALAALVARAQASPSA